ncbi:kinase interacting (KIP1-like) family protein [Euphorbia peplus]|nr:kinase interacting (KIP1-like) family protein [Euphorbia peplus]
MAAAPSRSDSRRMYSWWWDSHISPKNSKWLQENLTDMDVKVKQMIKLIEEDADSFARRAEMYYKKRPELMKMVEEFYRAYRALAERYDHATGVIRQAHRTMSEAFPNQVPSMMGDDLPAGATDGEPRTPEMPPTRALFDPEELQKDALGISQSPKAIKRNGAFTEEPDTVSGRKGLKQLNDLFGSTEGRARKGLHFHDAEEEDQNMEDTGKSEIKPRIPSDSERMGKAEMEILTLKNALAKLEAEKEAELLQYQQSLERLSNLESEVSNAKEDSQGFNARASKAEAEVQTLKEALSKLEAERESSFLQYQQCLEKIAKLEFNISHAEKDAGELTERARKAELETKSLKQVLAGVETEKEEALLQYKLCLEKISSLESKLLHAEESAMMFKESADKAEREVEILKQALTKLTEEQEATVIQYQQCLDTIAVLEQKLASAQEEAQRLNSEMDDGVVKLKGAEERCSLLEKSNQTMYSELESLAQKMAAQSNEVTEKQKELGRLWACIQEERLRFVEAETAFQTLQHLHSQSQEELRSMAAEIKNRSQTLQDLEARNQILQDEVKVVKVENKGLNEINLSSSLTIRGLQDEISSLRETIGKLEAEVELRLDERNALQQEIYCLKEELNDLNKKQQTIKEQVESVGFSPESLGSSLKDLQDENKKLKEVCEKERNEKVGHLEKLIIMEKLMEKNDLLENSLSDLNVELDGVREKVRALEESCQSLMGEKSTLVSEKATLVSQLQIATDNLEKLEEKNNFLETSLLDANAEIEGLRIKSRSLQDSYALLENHKSDLHSEKGNLVSQLDSTQKRLEELEKNYLGLEERHLDLERERQSSLHEVEELRTHLDAQKQEYASLVQLSESQLTGMGAKVRLLQEEGKRVKKEYEEQQLDKDFSAQTEIFILQKCVLDLEENNFSVLLEFQKLLEASQLSEKLISELEQENLEQQVEVKSLYDQIKVLRMGLYRVLKTLELDSNQWYQGKAEQDQMLLNLTLLKLQATQKMVSELQDENQQLLIENSVIVTLLGQLQREVENLVTAKNLLDHELAGRSEQYLVLQSDSRKISAMNEVLSLKIMEGNHKEEVLKVELKNLQGELLDLQGAYKTLQEESRKMSDEERSLKNLISELGEEKSNLEEENCAIFAEKASLGILSLIFKDTISTKLLEIEKLSKNYDKLFHVHDGLNLKGKMMEEKLLELSVLQGETTELHKTLEYLKSRCDEVELKGSNQEKQIMKLSTDYDEQSKVLQCIQETNLKLDSELQLLNEELVEAKSREDILNSEMQKGRNEIEHWESQAAALYGELQISAVHQALFEGKIHELIEACKSLERRNCSKDLELEQMKERLGPLESENEDLKTQMMSYIPAFISLSDCITSLENHTLSHMTLHEADKETKDVTLGRQADSSQKISKELGDMGPDEVLDLQALEMRIRAIEEAMVERERVLILEISNANSKLGAKIEQLEELESRKSMHQELIAGGKQGIQKPEKEPRHEKSGSGNDVMTKDIMLDQISECSSYGMSRRETVEADDQMLEIWETTEQDSSIDFTVGKAPKAIEKKRRAHPSRETVLEKDVSVDKLEISRRMSGSRQEVSGRKVLERLDSDAQKLTNLQITVEDLKRKVEITEKNKNGKGIEYDNVKEQLEESEETITKLVDANRRLTKSIKDDPLSSDEKTAFSSDEIGNARRKISEEARRGSEKIGRLQLEVQKLQFLLLKIDGENKSRGKAKMIERKTSVLLRDYLYGGGTRTGQKHKRRHFCACVQPPTKGD